MLKVRLCKDLGCESSDGIDNVFKLLVDCLGGHRAKPNQIRFAFKYLSATDHGLADEMPATPRCIALWRTKGLKEEDLDRAVQWLHTQHRRA